MSAPSKEEIASWTADMLADASRCIDIWNRAEASGRSLRGMIRPEGAYVIASLSDENERLLTDLREEVETNVELRAKLDSVRDENERLANELKAAQLDWDRLALENERLRADLDAMSASFDEATDHLKRLLDENELLRAERAECLELLGDEGRSCCPDALTADCHYSDGGPCWEHRRRALLAKLRGQS